MALVSAYTAQRIPREIVRTLDQIYPEQPDLNPPPTEGLLWPRFDYQIPES
jgi:hypothetical protein